MFGIKVIVHFTAFRAAVECRALLIVIEGRSGVRTLRPVDWQGIAPALRERALAIAIAELLQAREGDPAANEGKPGRRRDPEPVPRVRVGEPLSTRPAPHPSERHARSGVPLKQPPRAPVFLSGGLEWRFLFGYNTTLTGGRIAASLPAGSDWLARLSAEAGAFYDSGQNLAEVSELWLATGSLGMSAGLSLDIEISHVLRGLDAPALGRSPRGIRGALGGGRIGVAMEL